MTTVSNQTNKDAPSKLPNNQEVVTKLTAELEDIFTKEKLGSSPQVILKMNENLEIPITALYKEKRVLAITTNLALIREALKHVTNVIYDQKREIVRLNIKPLKNVLTVNHLEDGEKERFLNLLTESPEYKRRTSENFFNADGGYSLVLQSEEDAESLKAFLLKQEFKSRQLEITVEQENLYQTITQKSQDAMKYSYQTYGYGYGQMDPSFYYQNYYYFANMYQGYYPPNFAYGGGRGGYEQEEYAYPGKGYGKKGGRGHGGYSQKEGEDNQHYDDEGEEEGEEYHSKSYGGRGGRNQKKKGHGTGHGGGHKQGREYEKKSPQKGEIQPLSPQKQEEIIKRTRINSENFPSLSKPETTETSSPVETKSSKLKHGSKIIHIQKAEIIKEFERIQKEGTLKIAPSLTKLNAEIIPVIEPKGELALEVIQPKTIVREVRRRRTIEESPSQGGMILGEAPHKVEI
eukprot:CAMPEP_0176436386 /NCGR_PEP_ID=MMETSP0127-20121128/17939_1 /TAXON_ID=938130 /ORGANISM="Platyophrya macrostoma, Strain WH" /LENGTH=460 /DNA_ID=CAMNT_0017819699 /DNA_START=74 /DNA_END=1456 /DNA_ORIENTATION=+